MTAMTIYVVTASEGEYDSYSEWNIKGFLVKTDAEAHVAKLLARQNRLAHLQSIGKPVCAQYFHQGAQPAPQLHLMKPLPKITKGMKKVQMPPEWHERFREAEAHNQRLIRAHDEIRNNWYDAGKDLVRAALVEAGATEEEMEALQLPWCHGGNRDTSYDIEELEVE